jgi:dolichol kinase
MFDSEVWTNLFLLLACYAYILSVIFVTGKIENNLSKNTSRKFLHLMVGNLPFIIVFFSFNTFPLNFPFFVAAPFILLTFLVSPYSPLKSISKKMSGLTEVTEGGHHLGLVFYAISYTILASVFSTKPYIIAAGILPMAYGDAAASLVGEKFGAKKFCLFAKKSVEGSAAMFTITLASLAVSFLFFSQFYSLPIATSFFAIFAVAITSTFIEALTPKGFDNITVPLIGSLLFAFLVGGI